MKFFPECTVLFSRIATLELLKIFKRILIAIGSLLLLVLLAAFIVLRFYEDEVVEFALGRAKTQFTTRVDIGHAELTFWKTFPHAALHLNDVYIEETFATKDTLIAARSVYLEFSLLDLFHSKYDIHAIAIEEARCRFRVNDEGGDNWHFWKESKDSSEFKLGLQEVKLNASHILYDDRKNQFLLEMTSNESTGEGNFVGSKFDVDVEMDGTMHHLRSGKEDYALDKKFSTEAIFNADTDKNYYFFEKCNIAVERMPFIIEGYVDVSDKSMIDLHIKGDDLELDDMMESLTQSQRKAFAGYSPSGDIDFDLKIKGEMEGKKKPSVDLHCVVRDGKLKHRSSGVSLDNLACDIRYVGGGKEDVLSIRNLQTNLEDGFIQAQGILTNLKHPLLDLVVESSMDLADIKKFFAMDTLEVCQGNITAKAHINGTLTYVEADSAYDWRALLTSGNAQLTNGLVKIRNSNRQFSDVNANILFDKKNVSVQNLSGIVNGSDFKINGELNNLLPFLTAKNEHLQLDARLNSELMDFTNLVETETSTSGSSDYRFELPERVDFTLNSNIKKFVFRKFVATNVKGVAGLHGKKLVIDPVSFNTAGGQFTAQLAMERSGEELYRLNCLANLKSIDIRELFTEFENFDQEFIQDKHLKGEANATVQFRTPLTTSLDIVTDKIESLIDISIVNGELNNLESLQEIADYIRKNKWVAPFVDEDRFAEKMKNVSFSKLENVIEIKDRVITIPLMDIKSSAMDISARGTHTFDNRIDYGIAFNLRDVLVKKQKDYEEMDDGLGKRVFVSMKGTTDNPEFSVDKEMGKAVRQEEMQAEKQNVKALLKEELGLFKKDKSVGTYKEDVQPSGSTTTLQWEDADVQAEKPKEKQKEEIKKPVADKPKPDEPKKKVPKWLQEKD